jgi:hypothetical protein
MLIALYLQHLENVCTAFWSNISTLVSYVYYICKWMENNKLIFKAEYVLHRHGFLNESNNQQYSVT